MDPKTIAILGAGGSGGEGRAPRPGPERLQDALSAGLGKGKRGQPARTLVVARTAPDAFASYQKKGT
ncbi:MAG: hypothetical protein WBD05_04090 [Phycisphaerae bacterium]